MSYTKYVMSGEGKFAIISKMTGVEHSTLGQLTIGAHRITTAGFLVLNDDATIQSYGKSYSTGKESVPEDGEAIAAAIQRGEVSILENEQAGFFYATNRVQDGDATSVTIRSATISDLQRHRIFEND